MSHCMYNYYVPIKSKNFFLIFSKPGVMVCTCNLSTLEAGGKRIESSKPGWETQQNPVLIS
jgi:hypothetical protein